MLVLCSGHTYAHVKFPDGSIRLVPIRDVADLIWTQDQIAL